MDDLISRQAAIDAVNNILADYVPYLYGVTEAIPLDCAVTIQMLPSAQPKIIRCKECKHYEIWQLKSDYTDDKRFKPSVCVLGRYAVHRPEDWYCADAERRANGRD